MKWAVLMILLLTLLADVYIYRGVVCQYFRRLPARIGYIAFAALTYCAGLSMFLIYGFAAGRGPAVVMTVMWMVWVFFLTALPRLLFAAGGFVDWLISSVARKRVLFFRPLAIILSVVGVVFMIYGATAGRTEVELKEVEVVSERVPEGFDGYRIVQFSDLHVGTMARPQKRVAAMAAIINGLDADLVVNTGDIVNIDCRDLSEDVVSELSRIRSRDGVVSVYGNHDLGFYIKDSLALPLEENLVRLKGVLDSIGWKTLCDESYYLHRGGDSVLVAGLNFPPDGRLNGHNAHLSGVDMERTFAGTDPETFSLVLSHAPQMWDEITGLGYGDLTLSGHVHSMQLKLRLFGRDWSPAKYLYREWSGMYEKNKRYLYINDGMGCVGYPMRIGAKPELTLITLKRCE